MKKSALLAKSALQFDDGLEPDLEITHGHGHKRGHSHKDNKGLEQSQGAERGHHGRDSAGTSGEHDSSDTLVSTSVVEAKGHHDGTASVTEEATQTVSVTYSDEAISELLFMIEEEKLAGDVYDAFYDLYGLDIFKNIAASEDKHFSALVDLAEQIGLDVDEFVMEPKGSFVDEEIQSLYDSMIATGSASATAALEVGLAIEEKDMVDIAAAIEEVEGTTLAEIYDNLLTGSSYHLDAFETALMI
ncbi:MAG: DUF2202 domain-containing protein [Pseudodonghicola sp.]